MYETRPLQKKDRDSNYYQINIPYIFIKNLKWKKGDSISMKLKGRKIVMKRLNKKR